MTRIQFENEINAPAEKVWKILWDDVTYRKWTSVFSEGSHAVSDWKEGSKILFLGPDGGGMYSRIDKMIPNQLMSFRHEGVMKDNKELPLDEESKKWTGAEEIYRLEQNGDKTKLKVELDTVDGHKDYFSEKFPLAIARVKEMAEA